MHDSELQREKDEVTRLKEKVEGLKRQHKVDLVKVKEDYESKKTQAVNETTKSFETEIQRQKELAGIERRLNELQKQQVEALKAKMNGWRDVAERLKHEMEGAILEPYWSHMEDHMVAMSARVSHMKETLDFDALETLRSGSTTLLDEALIKKRKARAYEIAQTTIGEQVLPDKGESGRADRTWRTGQMEPRAALGLLPGAFPGERLRAQKRSLRAKAWLGRPREGLGNQASLAI
ncbi:hypothetical protein QYE76_041167 [Lolium multiflorum]|uniref:Uncharacterized protein n=1 Tax=Lolium multiflorum TaxID=4521 RepID=A0AAD8TCU1_LOLMU|nr:hypothetical protein QYE76_041167 [Lolium multiflorum]